MTADLIVSNIGQLVTCAAGGAPKRGLQMRDIGMIEGAAVAIRQGKIGAIGTSEEILRDNQSADLIDAGGRVVCPGFVDPHTHIVFAGDRLDEFELKIKGAEYLEILASGGGIISTVKQTRAASLEELVRLSTRRLNEMLACGTTTCEIKTGYGLDLETELKMLEAIAELDRGHPMTIVPTLLAAHAVPPEYKDNADGYVNLVCDKILSEAWKWFVGSPFHGRTPFFCDVFCEKGAFTLKQSTLILESARSLGMKIKAHVDQFNNLGGSELYVRMGAVSIDHLDAISDVEIAQLANSETVGVVTPTVNFNSGSTHFADARRLIDAGCAVAVSTDYNPGSAPCPSQPMAMAIACRYQKLLPAETLNAATINAAYSIGLGSLAGSIEVGKQADLLVLDTSDHRQLMYEFGGDLISAVIKNGKPIIQP